MPLAIGRVGPIPRTRAQLALYATVFIDLLGFTLVLPSLPFQVTTLGGDAFWLGVVLTSYSVCQAAAAPVLGRLADRHGRRRLLLLSLAGTTASLALLGLAGSLWLLLVARATAGLCGGSIGVAQAFAADLAGPAGRTKAMGSIGAAIGLAFTIGPALGALATPLGFTTTALIGAALAAANLALAARTLPPDHNDRPHPPKSGGQDTPSPPQAANLDTTAHIPPPKPGRRVTPRRLLAAARALPRRRNNRPHLPNPGRRATNLTAAHTLPSGPVNHPHQPKPGRRLAPWPLLAAGFASMAAFVGMETTVAYLVAARFGAGPAMVGMLLASAGLTLVIVQGLLVAPAAKRWGEARIAAGGGLFMAVGLLAMPFLPEAPFILAVLLVAGGNGMVTTATASLLAAAGPPEQTGARMGQGQSAASAARAAGPLAAGALFELAMTAPYLLGAALSLGVALIPAKSAKITH